MGRLQEVWHSKDHSRQHVATHPRNSSGNLQLCESIPNSFSKFCLGYRLYYLDGRFATPRHLEPDQGGEFEDLEGDS